MGKKNLSSSISWQCWTSEILALGAGEEFENEIVNEIDELSTAYLKITTALTPRLYLTQLKMTP